jgi:hypothetical protein
MYSTELRIQRGSSPHPLLCAGCWVCGSSQECLSRRHVGKPTQTLPNSHEEHEELSRSLYVEGGGILEFYLSCVIGCVACVLPLSLEGQAGGRALIRAGALVGTGRDSVRLVPLC